MFAPKLDKMSRYDSLIEKHLNYFRGRGFRLLNDRVYCDFCEYSIKIDKTHIKTQLSSHLKCQKHRKSEVIKGLLDNAIRQALPLYGFSRMICEKSNDSRNVLVRNFGLQTGSLSDRNDSSNSVSGKTTFRSNGDQTTSDSKDIKQDFCEVSPHYQKKHMSRSVLPDKRDFRLNKKNDSENERISLFNKPKSQVRQRPQQQLFDENQPQQQLNLNDQSMQCQDEPCGRQFNQFRMHLPMNDANRVLGISLTIKNGSLPNAVFNSQNDLKGLDFILLMQL